jgi:hypothetical protein
VPSNRVPPDERYILRILGRAPDPLFPSEISKRLNDELGAGARYTMTEVAMRLKALGQKVEQLKTPDSQENGSAKVNRPAAPEFLHTRMDVSGKLYYRDRVTNMRTNSCNR